MNIDLKKYSDGLVPAIIQDVATGDVLMLGFMNAEAIAKTKETGRVTFFSRSKDRLWTKGETSGNFLEVVAILSDCDNDTLLIRARPNGPICHKGTTTCFGNVEHPNFSVLTEIESVIKDRRDHPIESSYVSKLFAQGINRIAQRVGEEAIETVIAAKDDDLEAFKSEAADLLFHYLVLLQEKGVEFRDILAVLEERRA